MKPPAAQKGYVFDIVCGQVVDPDEVGYRASYEGRTYYFCCAKCLRNFKTEPQRYVHQDHVYGPFH
jgi:P-type Cu+ transporter